MCNRFRSIDDLDVLPASFWRGARLNFPFNPNVAPTETVPALLAGNAGEPRAQIARFGVRLPTNTLLLNVRMETLRKGAFKNTLATHPCAIPAAGFYEWRSEDGGKQPYYFTRADNKPILFCGVWALNEVHGEAVPAFAIITTTPNALLASFHDRMPVIVDDAEPWLASADLDAIDPLPADALAVRPVNRAVNKVSTKSLELIERPEAPAQGRLL